MAKFVKITNNLSINIDCIYSIYREESQEILLNIDEINDWEKRFELYKEEFSKYPAPALEISPGILYQPGVSKFGELQNELYYQKLKENITKEIGESPEPIYGYNYYLLLNNGTKVNIDKVIYDKLMEEVRD